VPYTYAPGHRLATVGGAPITFHPDGHRASDPGRSYDVDALGRLAAVRGPGGAVLLDCRYDPLGRPAVITEPGRTRRLRYLGDAVAQEDRGGVAFRQWTEHPTLGVPLLVHRQGRSLSRLHGGTLELLALVDHTGTPVARYRYDAFGQPTVRDGAGTGAPPATAPVEEPLFGAMWQLGAAGLYATPVRAMDPRTGQFLARDPVPFLDGPSPYSYACQAPLDVIDPRGDLAFLAVLAVVAVGALIGGGVSAARQGIGIATGERREPFSWGEVGWGAVTGGVLAPIVVVAPEVAVPVLTGFGLSSAVDEAAQSHWATAGFDAVLAVAPFKSAKFRGQLFSRGSLLMVPRYGISSLGNFGSRFAIFNLPPGFRPPGVKVVQIDFQGVKAWQKTVDVALPGLRQWAELTIRAQVKALRKLEAGGVPSAKILQDYQPGGALIIEDAGVQASQALKANPGLRGQYNTYYKDAVTALGWPRAGRIPGIRVLLHDLKEHNIGWTPERGFVAFDPALDPVTVTVGVVGGLALAGGGLAALYPYAAEAAEPPYSSPIPGDGFGPSPASDISTAKP